MLSIDEEKRHFAFVHGRIGRSSDVAGQFSLATANDSAGVKDMKRLVAQCTGREEAIASDSRLVVDDRDASSSEPIEERGFADVRPANDDNCWKFSRASWHSNDQRGLALACPATWSCRTPSRT